MLATQHRESVGIVGLGRMGRSIAQRLFQEGFTTLAWNRSAFSPDAAAELGIRVRSTLSEMVKSSDVIILSLYDDAAVSDVLMQVLAADPINKLVVDTSTVSPNTLRAFADRFANYHSSLIDGPISGGPEQIRVGKAAFFIGGAVHDVERFMPIATALADRVLHIGDLGSGATAKILNNMMLVGFWESLKETLLLGKAAGIAPKLVLDLIAGGPSANPALKSRLPTIVGESDTVGFTLSGAAKDAALVQHLATELAVQIPAVSAGLQSFRAAEAKGLGNQDLAVMVRDAYRG
jgi:3-hydroxyisobutyrate dehydrogenase